MCRRGGKPKKSIKPKLKNKSKNRKKYKMQEQVSYAGANPPDAGDEADNTLLIFSEVLDRFKTVNITEFSKKEISFTKPGSIKYLLFGREPSKQSISIKLGRIIGEHLPIMIIKTNPDLQLLNCGIHKLITCNVKKDFDLVWYNKKTNVLHYRECKGNIQMDTEKVPATIHKVKKLEKDLKVKYKDYTVDAGVMAWSIYEREDVVPGGGKAEIKKFQKEEVKVDHFKDFLSLIGVEWDKESFYSYFKEIGTIIEDALNSS